MIFRHGDPYHVLETDRHGYPLVVSAASPWLQGSFDEAMFNLELRVASLGRELRAALPAWVRRFLA